MRRAGLVAVVLLLAACSSSTKPASPVATTTTSGAPKADCTPARTAPPVRTSYTFQGRTYRLAVPPDYDGVHARPMVLLFHGFASNAKAFDVETSFDRLGHARGFIVVTPDGSGNPLSWNLFDPAASDDYGFVEKLVAHVAGELCVDHARIFASGHSAGAAFTGFLVCRKPYLFAASTTVSATVPSTCPPDRKQSVLGIHGTDDPAVLYDGGKGVGQSVAIPPVKETIAEYREAGVVRRDAGGGSARARRGTPAVPRLRVGRAGRAAHDRRRRPPVAGWSPGQPGHEGRCRRALRREHPRSSTSSTGSAVSRDSVPA